MLLNTRLTGARRLTAAAVGTCDQHQSRSTVRCSVHTIWAVCPTLIHARAHTHMRTRAHIHSIQLEDAFTALALTLAPSPTLTLPDGDETVKVGQKIRT